jgi:hypothetical protein
VAKESCYAMNGGFPQIRRAGDGANVTFLGWRGPECSGVATAHDLCRTMGNIGGNP